MKIKYLSGAQATSIKADYHHLVGQPFGANDGTPTTRTISLITEAPYSRILQWSFARLLSKGTPASDALRQWPLDRFDVVLISFNPADPADFMLKDLRSYLEEIRLEFDASRYRRSAQRRPLAKMA